MIGLVLVTHGRLAEELRHAMEHVVGPQRAVATVCIGPDDDMEDCRQDIRASIAQVNQGDGVVVLTDILGGTPSNLAISLADRKTVDVIAGVNLPLLVKLAKIRGSEPLATAVAHATAAGRKYIACTGEMPNGDGAPVTTAAAAASAAGGAPAATGSNGTRGGRP
jgi:PTS system mannose-specific IIA component